MAEYEELQDEKISNLKCYEELLSSLNIRQTHLREDEHSRMAQLESVKAFMSKTVAETKLEAEEV